MNPFFLVGAATVGIVGYTLKALGRNDVLENPFPIRVCGERESVFKAIEEALKNFGGNAWVWTIVEHNTAAGLLKAECLCTQRDERPIKLTVSFDKTTSSILLKFEVQALFNRGNSNKVLERTQKAIIFSLDTMFDEHINDPMLSIEKLLLLLQENIGGKRLLSDRQFADVKLEIERRAQATLNPGDELVAGNYSVKVLSNRRVRVGKLRVENPAEKSKGGTDSKDVPKAESNGKSGKLKSLSLKKSKSD
ncbi:MAG: hypothetical protein IT343_05430 [Candidatus Melainabacteria bacterium]|nr:hypothetical protein [Candidatus Melainabacteria bacterium]